MTRRRPRLFDETRGHTPRGITASEAAWHLGLSENDFHDRLPRLLGAGFPKPDPLTTRYDIRAIDAWLDERAGLSNHSAFNDNDIDRELEAFASGENPRAALR